MLQHFGEVVRTYTTREQLIGKDEATIFGVWIRIILTSFDELNNFRMIVIRDQVSVDLKKKMIEMTSRRQRETLQNTNECIVHLP